MTDISHHVDKVSKFPLEQTIFVSDYDLTLADKLNPKNPDDSPLRDDHYANLVQKAKQGMQVVVVTARGETSAKGYLTEHADKHGEIPGLVLASNSGHVVNRDIYGNGEQEIIKIPGYNMQTLESIVGGIHGIVHGLKRHYPHITADTRELCGAVIYKLPGTEDDKAFQDFQALAKDLTQRLPIGVSERVKAAPKSWAAVSEDGKPEVHGYIDFIPHGMSKADPTRMLMEETMGKVKGPHYAIASGDSASDGPLLSAVAHQIPPERLLLVSVGSGLSSWAKEAGREDVAYIHANGDSAINRYHDLLTQVGVKAQDAEPTRAARTGARAATGLPAAGLGSAT